jgi:hypothetical protein
VDKEHVRGVGEFPLVAGVGPSQVAEIVESILSLGPDFGPISSFLRPKRGLLSGIHGKSYRVRAKWHYNPGQKIQMYD